jgi:hypothetical protein
MSVDMHGYVCDGIDVHGKLVDVGSRFIRISVVIKLVFPFIVVVIHVVCWMGVVACARESKSRVKVVVAHDPDEAAVLGDTDGRGRCIPEAWVYVRKELCLRSIGTLQAVQEGKENGIWCVCMC